MEFLSGIAVVVEPFTKIQRWWVGLSDIVYEGEWYWQHTGDQMVLGFWDEESPIITNTSYNSVFMELESGSSSGRIKNVSKEPKVKFKLHHFVRKTLSKQISQN